MNGSQLNVREFLGHESVQLPLRRNSEDFEKFVEETLGQYLNLLTLLVECEVSKEVNKQRTTIETFCELAKQAIGSMYKGRPHEAYEHFSRAVEPISDLLKKSPLSRSQFDWFYRLRTDDSGSLTREELFHPPFEKRHLVASQRYSVPGLPCLYLGGSLYTCWEELDRPPFHQLHVSAFWLRNPAKQPTLLYVTDRPARLLLAVEENGGIQQSPFANTIEEITRHLVLWPLMALCSTVVKHSKGAFKPEYIIPQLLLQWVAQNSELDGICYFSTHINAVTNEYWPTANLVFPVRQIKPTGRCADLRDMFGMTRPESWELLRSVQGFPTPADSISALVVPAFHIELLEGCAEEYALTEFGKIETKLNNQARHLRKKNETGDAEAGQVSE